MKLLLSRNVTLHRWSLALLSGLTLLAGQCFLNGATLVVDARAGQGRFQTIQAALDQAKAGDTVHVRSGVYKERLVFKAGGSEGQPIVLEGEEDAIIDGSADVKLAWAPAPDVGPGVYRTTLDFFPFTITSDGLTVTTLDEKRVDPALNHPERDNIRWPDAFKNGVGPAGWDGVRSLALYRKKERDLLIHFKDDLDPRKMKITVGPKEPCIMIDGQSYCVIKGLKIGYAAYGIAIKNSEHDVIENCKIGPADYGIYLGKGANGCVVRYNEIFLAPYAGASPHRAGSWDAWTACKNGGFYDRYAIQASEGKYHEIHDNFIHDHWDGIEAGFPGTTEENGGLNVHHNYISKIFDDAVETSGGQMDNRWHDNFIEGARTAIRIKDAMSGPFYIYRNLFSENENDMVIFPGKHNLPEMWAYHNTSTSEVSVGTNFARNESATAPDFHFYNNLFWCQNTLRRKASYPLPSWKADYNVFIRMSPEASRPKNAKHPPLTPEQRRDVWEKSIAEMKEAQIDKHSLWVADGAPGFVNPAQRNFALTETSPARARGIDLTKVAGRVLPGCEPGYYKGENPDAGALQFEETMPQLPRKPVASK